MSIHVLDLLALVWVHLLADFFLQSESMATKKSTSNGWLAYHVAVYSICLIPFGFFFALLNAILHFGTDYTSSRLTTKLWRAKKVRRFFDVIGTDQAVHMTCLIVTFPLIGNTIFG